MMVQRIQRVGWRSRRLKTDAARVVKKSRCSTDRLAKYFNALGPFAEIVEAVYECRSSGLSSDFGCTNNSHSGKANEDVGAPAELGYPTSKCPNVKN
jgi:hypothetical protein